MRTSSYSKLLIHAILLCCVRSAWAFHTIPCSDSTIQGAIDSILAEERANGGADGVDYYIALGGGLVFNEPVVINDNGTPGGVVVAIIGGLAIDPTDPNQCAASPGVFDGSDTMMSGGGRFHQSVIQITGDATVFLDRLTLSGASLGGSGGGISFDGAGLLGLYGVNIAGNSAGSGAGIHASGNGAPGGLGIEFHDLVTPEGLRFTNIIQGNTATNGPGGGVDLTGNAYLVANDGTLVVSQNTASGNGGGIALRGSGRVELGQNVQIVGNSAANGGGIFSQPAAVGALVTLLDGVLIGANRVTEDGGGLYLTGRTTLDATSANQPTQIIANQSSSAGGRGGGVFLAGPASGTFTGTITDNQAGYGGGIFMTADADGPSLRLNGQGGAAPVAISRNYATSFGGGIYAETAEGDGASVIHASNYTMEGNAALDGSAIYGDSGGQLVSLLFNGGDACAGQAKCNTIAGNYLANGATNGSTIALTGNRLDVDLLNARIQGNVGKHLVSAQSAGGNVSLQTALLTGNTSGSQLIDMGPGILHIADATIAENSILDGSTVMRAKNVFFYDSIVSEQELDTFDYAGNADGGHNIDDVLTNPLDNTMTNADGRVLRGRPTFVDAANGNYHLAPYSLGIDVGRANPEVPLGLDRIPRDVDQSQTPDLDGPRDLGAYEFVGDFTACSAPDTIFCTPFE